MKVRRVVFSKVASEHLLEIAHWIGEAASYAVAIRYVERVEAYLYNFDIFAERGTRCDDIRQGLRIIGFERRLTIAFTVDAESVIILGIYCSGQDWASALGDR